MEAEKGFINLTVLTPEGEMFSSNQVVQISVESESGSIGIKADHEPLMAVLKLSELQIESSQDKTSFVISGGILKISDQSTVEIFTDTAQRATDIDIKTSEEAIEAAERLIVQGGTEIDLVKLNALIELESLKVRVKRKGLV